MIILWKSLLHFAPYLSTYACTFIRTSIDWTFIYKFYWFSDLLYFIACSVSRHIQKKDKSNSLILENQCENIRVGACCLRTIQNAESTKENIEFQVQTHIKFNHLFIWKNCKLKMDIFYELYVICKHIFCLHSSCTCCNATKRLKSKRQMLWGKKLLKRMKKKDFFPKSIQALNRF